MNPEFTSCHRFRELCVFGTNLVELSFVISKIIIPFPHAAETHREDQMG